MKVYHVREQKYLNTISSVFVFTINKLMFDFVIDDFFANVRNKAFNLIDENFMTRIFALNINTDKIKWL